MFPVLETVFQVQIQHKNVVEGDICVSRYVEERQNLLISIPDVCVINFSAFFFFFHFNMAKLFAFFVGTVCMSDQSLT
jgi:hypothetical protein